MVDLSHWDFVDEFSATDAASLILGVDPSNSQEAIKAKPILERMRLSYHLAWGYWHVRCDGNFEFNEEVNLPIDAIQSVDMQLHTKSLIQSGILGRYQEYFCHWIGYKTSDEPEQFGSGFSLQRFSRGELSRWILALNVESKYKFTRDLDNGTEKITSSQADRSKPSPEERRTHVEEVLKKHNGNKTQAAKELGVSRVRVGQILNKNVKADRKPLTLSPQDPFGLIKKIPSNKSSE